MHLVQDLGQTYGTARGASRAPLVRGSVRCRRGRHSARQHTLGEGAIAHAALLQRHVSQPSRCFDVYW
jgi:hypothetical protein